MYLTSGSTPGWSTPIPEEFPWCSTYIGPFTLAASTFQVWEGGGVFSLSNIGLSDPRLEMLRAEVGVDA